MKMTNKVGYAQPTDVTVDYEDYGVDTLSNYEREKELSVYERIKREKEMTQENQIIHDNKIAEARVMYRDLPPWAQEFVDEYRSSIVRLGRINGTGPDEMLKFIEGIKNVVDRTADNIFDSASKGVIGQYQRGSGV